VRTKAPPGPTAYKDTPTNYLKTQAEIGRLLEKHGIIDTRFTMVGSLGQLVIEFAKPETIEGQQRMLGVRIVVPNLTAKNRDQLHRALYHWLKTKFESLQFGFVEFTEEFFAHLVLTDRAGRTTTMYEQLGPGYRQGILTGQVQELQLLPAGDGRYGAGEVARGR
jgi:stress-induced morphogen